LIKEDDDEPTPEELELMRQQAEKKLAKLRAREALIDRKIKAIWRSRQRV